MSFYRTIGPLILLWHSLSLPYNYTSVCVRNMGSRIASNIKGKGMMIIIIIVRDSFKSW